MMMKRNVLLILFLAGLLNAIAQTDYYYYQGNKIPLTRNEDKVCISIYKDATETSERIQSNAPIQVTIEDETFNIFVLSLSDFEKLSLQDFWKEDSKVVILTSVYLTERNEEVVVTPYLNVRLKEEQDIDLLTSYAEQYRLKIIRNSPLMPLWYILSVTPESEKGPLECANELYESGDFAASVPDFASLLDITTIRDVTVPNTSASTAITLFNLQGQRLTDKPRKGIYIQNGRKFVMK